jgi:hypothetical protein
LIGIGMLFYYYYCFVKNKNRQREATVDDRVGREWGEGEMHT